MPIIIEANYSKKIGLPNYSSHQYSLTVRSEISDINQVPQESQRLYSLMQSCVDQELQQTGFLPGEAAPKNGHSNGNGHRQVKPAAEEPWNSSDKQKELILKIVEEHKLDKNHIENLAQQRFNKGVKTLNKLEASGLIDELLEQTGQKKAGRRFEKAGGR